MKYISHFTTPSLFACSGAVFDHLDPRCALPQQDSLLLVSNSLGMNHQHQFHVVGFKLTWYESPASIPYCWFQTHLIWITSINSLLLVSNSLGMNHQHQFHVCHAKYLLTILVFFYCNEKFS
jgi:hypothetical protein